MDSINNLVSNLQSPLAPSDVKTITIPDGMNIVTYIESLLRENDRLTKEIKEYEEDMAKLVAMAKHRNKDSEEETPYA